ncbi:MAG: hypothetical protein EA380_07190 [Phycisphaeraceae bacterium]|nr:MAG: hypothetical protein EA380_07190 [Phycisphaeraceae bacterium]
MALESFLSRVVFRPRTALLTGAVLVASGVAVAQDSGLYDRARPDPEVVQQDITEDEPSALSLKLHGAYRHEFQTEIKGSDAKFQVDRVNGGIGLGYRLSPELNLRGSFDYEYSDYRFKRADTLLPGVTSGNPFDPFHTLTVSAGLDYRLNEQWTISGTGFVRSAYEEGADFGDSMTGGGFGFVTYRFNSDLALGFGLGATSRLEDDALLLPVLFIQWRIDDQWSVRSDGLGARLNWAASPEFSVFLHAKYERDEWRLDDDRGDVSEGVLRDRRVPIGVGVDWRPIAGLTITGEVSVFVYRELEFLNDRGRSVVEEKTDEIMPALGFRAEWRF